jgi:hypothetical protein
MPPSQVVSWTAIPNGIALGDGGNRSLKLSVFVSPRLQIVSPELQIKGTLSSSIEIKDWLDWPSKIRSMAFDVVFNKPGNQVSIIKAELDSARRESPPDSTLWTRLFKPDTIVKSYQYKDQDFGNKTKFVIRSFSLAKNHEFLKNTYTSIATDSPVKFPHIRYISSLNSFGQVASVGRLANQNEPSGIETEDKILSVIKEETKTNGLLHPRNIEAKYGFKGHFVQLKHFHYQNKSSRIPIEKPARIENPVERDKAQKDLEEKLDFHQIISSLSQYPELMRRLGLIIDLIIPGNDVPASNWQSPLSLTISSSQFRKIIDQPLRTFYIYDGSSFITPPSKDLESEPKISNGMLRLNEENQYQVVQIDIDGGSMKANKFINRVINTAAQKVFKRQKIELRNKLLQQRVKLRSDGPALQRFKLKPDNPELLTLKNRLKLNRASILPKEISEYINSEVDDNNDENTSDKQACVPPLRSESISVIKNDRAHDYCRRFVRSQKINNDLDKKINNDLDNRDNFQTSQDIVFDAQDLTRGYRIDIRDNVSKKWRSLCKRRGTYQIYGPENTPPETYLNDFTDEGWVQTGITQIKSDDEPDMKDLRVHESLFKWQGWSLCAPRPGKPIDPYDTIEKIDNKPITQLKLRTSFTAEPGSLPRLRFGREYEIRARVVDLCGNSVKLEQANDQCSTKRFTFLRFEPVSSPVIVLRDQLSSLEKPGESLEHIVIRTPNDKEELDNVPTTDIAVRHIAPPKTSQMLAEMHGMFDDISGRMKSDESLYNDICKRQSKIDSPNQGSFEDWHDDINPNDNNNNATSKHYPIYRSDKAILPYLPDPMSIGATLRNLPGTDEHSSITKVDFGSKDQWPNLIPFRLIVKEPGINEVNLKPEWDPIERILTVKLHKGGINKVLISSYLGDDYQIMGLSEWASIKNSEKLKAAAKDGVHWMLTPYKEIYLVHAVKQPLGLPKFAKRLELGDQGDPDLGVFKLKERKLNDTKALLEGKINVHKESTLKLEINATWNEILDDPEHQILDDPEHQNPPSFEVPHASHVFEKKINQNEKHMPDAREKGKVWVQVEGYHFFEDTKYRKVKYQITTTSRFGDYFVYDRKDKNAIARMTPDSQSTSLDILNSKKPDPPKIKYIIPTLVWDTPPPVGNEAKRTRKSALRIYLERPWYTSGEGELLGVIIAEDPTDLTAPKPDGRYTQWGIDPVHSSQRELTMIPGVDDFEGGDGSDLVKTIKDFHKEYITEQHVSILGYQVHYDERKMLWYTDIEIKTLKSFFYFPFIRLGLVRLQPNSIRGAHVYVSSVVMADYAQLNPLRILRVKTTKEATRTLYLVSVYGNTAKYLDLRYNKNLDEYDWRQSDDYTQFDATVEKYNPKVGGDLGWEVVNKENHEVIINILNYQAPEIWLGSVTIPNNINERFRLVIKEYEWYVTDSDEFDNLPKDQNNENIFKIGEKIGIHDQFTRIGRLVYLDMIELRP